MSKDKDQPGTSSLKLWIGRFIILLAQLIILELVLRFISHTPGFIGTSIGERLFFKPVDSLIVDSLFYTDSDAIFKANYQNRKLFGYDATIQINSEGFRDQEFEVADESKVAVLLIGDSFCWGASAKPLNLSFADLLENYGYNVYNVGVPGTGPPQYQLLAEKFIPRLQPDKVVVTFYLANDIMYRDIPANPYANTYHQTNAGWMDPYLDGDYLDTPEACYEYYLKRFSIPTEESTFNRIMAKMVISTQIWKIFKRFGWIAHSEHPDVVKRKANNPYPEFDQPQSYKYLKAIEEQCLVYDVPFYLCVIPVHTALENNISNEHPTLFKDLKYYWPSLEVNDYYDWPDGHFTNKGHMKYARFLDLVLREKNAVNN